MIRARPRPPAPRTTPSACAVSTSTWSALSPGVNSRAKHFVGTRSVWATPESAKVIRDLLA
jgi:hypothetical protein